METYFITTQLIKTTEALSSIERSKLVFGEALRPFAWRRSPYVQLFFTPLDIVGQCESDGHEGKGLRQS